LSSDDSHGLAAEQAALRRVATLAARGAPPEEVFAAAVEEVVRVLPVDLARLGRYQPDRRVTYLATWGAQDHFLPVGRSYALGGRNLSTTVFETGRSARLDTFENASGPIGLVVRDKGVHSAVGTPIIVEGRVWGMMAAGSSRPEPLPSDAEERLASFTELLATAIANAEVRAGLTRLAEEQAGLRRVATLVAREAPPDELFAAVIEEVERVFAVEIVGLARFESGSSLTTVATSKPLADAFPVGGRWPLGGRNASTMVFETGRSARIDGIVDASGQLGVALPERRLASSVGAPIVVEGRLWGAMTVASSEGPLPADTEARLASFTELVATAIANIEARAEVAAWRARIVAAADEERRRVVRDLHDGAQRWLVHTIITLKLAQRAVTGEDEKVPALLTDALDHAQQAIDELRELAHGILPAALTQGGLRAGVNSLALRMPVPVDTDVSVGRLPAPIEAAAYFVVAEALTNVAKHARADRAEVKVRIERDVVEVQVRDDGVGGARPDGRGFVGLADRLTALGGELRVHSPAEGGTRVAASIPLPGESSCRQALTGELAATGTPAAPD
jgi:signal transduction histidine kinase